MGGRPVTEQGVLRNLNKRKSARRGDDYDGAALLGSTNILHPRLIVILCAENGARATQRQSSVRTGDLC